MNKLFDLRLYFMRLLSPPHAHILHLYVGEAPLIVLNKCLDARIKDVLDTCEVDILTSSVVVVIYCFEPANIIMCMVHEMHIVVMSIVGVRRILVVLLSLTFVVV